jgi:hypothetical protein
MLLGNLRQLLLYVRLVPFSRPSRNSLAGAADASKRRCQAHRSLATHQLQSALISPAGVAVLGSCCRALFVGLLGPAAHRPAGAADSRQLVPLLSDPLHADAHQLKALISLNSTPPRDLIAAKHSVDALAR